MLMFMIYLLDYLSALEQIAYNLRKYLIKNIMQSSEVGFTGV